MMPVHVTIVLQNEDCWTGLYGLFSGEEDLRDKKPTFSHFISIVGVLVLKVYFHMFVYSVE